MTEVIKTQYQIHARYKDSLGNPYYQLYTQYNDLQTAERNYRNLMRQPLRNGQLTSYVLYKSETVQTLEPVDVDLNAVDQAPNAGQPIVDDFIDDFEDDWED